MGPFFYSKYEIPANPKHLVNFSFFWFCLFIPPNAITFKGVCVDSLLNLLIPKKFLFNLNKDDKKINLICCFSFIFISLWLWADPNKIKFFLKLKGKWSKLLLNDGIYAPSKLNFIANLILLEINSLKLFFLQKVFKTRIFFSWIFSW